MALEKVKNARTPVLCTTQRAELVSTRNSVVSERLVKGGNYRQREESPHALLEAARDGGNTPLARAQAILKLEHEQAKELIFQEMSSDVCTALALISNNKEIGVLAAGKILEKDAILEVAIYAPWVEVRGVAQAKLTSKRDIELALELETDEELCHALKKALKKFPH